MLQPAVLLPISLVRGFTGGDPKIQPGLNRMWADRQSWPANIPKVFSDEVQAFMMKALAAGDRAQLKQK